jgi:hypothetical protein
MVYINQNWTEAQFIVRAVFGFIALVVFISYGGRVLCGVKKHHRSQVTLEQKSVAALSFLLFFFDNPWYLVQIYTPRMLTVTIAIL